MYFDQLSGAACLWNLVEILFWTFSNFFLLFNLSTTFSGGSLLPLILARLSTTDRRMVLRSRASRDHTNQAGLHATNKLLTFRRSPIDGRMVYSSGSQLGYRCQLFFRSQYKLTFSHLFKRLKRRKKSVNSQKSILTSFQVHVGPKSWSKYTMQRWKFSKPISLLVFYLYRWAKYERSSKYTSILPPIHTQWDTKLI